SRSWCGPISPGCSGASAGPWTVWRRPEQTTMPGGGPTTRRRCRRSWKWRKHMRTVQELESALLELAPYGMKEDWDNVGLLCGRGGQEVRRVLVALDPFQSVAQEAVEVGAQLLVTHHPLIFHPARAVTDRDPLGRTILYLVE